MILADSTNDFSRSQGEKNWHYLWIGKGSYSSTGVVAMAWSDSPEQQRWMYAGKYLPAIGKSRMDVIHWPDADEGESIAVRRWKSAFTGKVTISGYIHCHNDAGPKGGDGSDLRVYVNGVQVGSTMHSAPYVGSSGDKKEFSFPDVALKAGDLVDFAISGPNQALNFQTFTDTHFVISSTTSESK